MDKRVADLVWLIRMWRVFSCKSRGDEYMARDVANRSIERMLEFHQCCQGLNEHNLEEYVMVSPDLDKEFKRFCRNRSANRSAS